MEDDPELAAAIRASLGLSPLRRPAALPSANELPLFDVPSDNDDSGSDEIPDFEDEEAVERYVQQQAARQSRPARAQRPPPPPRPRSPTPEVQEFVERSRPGQWDGVWRGRSRLLDDDDQHEQRRQMQLQQEAEIEGPEYRLLLKRSREEEEARLAALRVPDLVPEGEDLSEEEMIRRAIEASMRPATPPPQSDEIDEEEEERFNQELQKAVEESRRAARGGGAGESSSSAAQAAAPPSPSGPLFQRPAPPVRTESQPATTDRSSSVTVTSSPDTNNHSPLPPPRPVSAPSDPQTSASAPTSNSSIFGGLSRAELEAERLARAKKRQLTDDATGASSSSAQPLSKKPRPTPSNTSARFMTFGDLPKDEEDSSASGSASRGATGSAWGGGSGGGGSPRIETYGSEERFWEGESGFTTNVQCSEPGKYFSLKGLIGDTSTLKFAILSTYCFEPDLITELFPFSVPTILVSQPPSSDLAGKSHHGSSVEGVWSCYPYLPPGWGGAGSSSFRGTAHMKFMLLFYADGRLRIVIMSANFMNFDWRSIENGVWVQDFRPRPAGQKLVKSDFGLQWEMILDSLGIPKTFRLVNPIHPDLPFSKISDIHRWDFSAVKVRLVASTSGTKKGWKEMESLGQCRLGKVLREEGWVAGKGRALKTIEAQCSSLGIYSSKWMNDFFRNASGKDPRGWLGRIPKDKAYPPVKILFPTLATVESTVNGKLGGGTFFCDDKKWKPDTKHLFHSAEAKRGPVLMHIKILLAIFEPLSSSSSSSLFPSSIVPSLKGKERAPPPVEIDLLSGSETEDEDGVPMSQSVKGKGKGKAVEEKKDKEEEKEDERVKGWWYMGSHNFTPSAWGTVSMGKDGEPSQAGSNYELGVLLPLTSSDPQSEANALTTWKRPARKYGSGDRPWMQYEHDLEGGHATGPGRDA